MRCSSGRRSSSKKGRTSTCWLDEGNKIDRAVRKVDLVDVNTGVTSTLPYDKLVIATGAVPFVPASLDGRDLDGVFTLTKISDANRIIAALAAADARKAVIVGGGLIGMESAEAFAEGGWTSAWWR
jgi:NADPH-dependent 2,4-dienoyl-CoA reductase/sulfur reductase-like enzyme